MSGGAMASTYEEAFVLERAHLANAELSFMKFYGEAERLRSYRAMTKDLVFPKR